MTTIIPPATAKPAVLLYLAAMGSGLLQYASFFPLNLGFLAWFALVPLLILVRSEARPRHVYLAAFVGGLEFYLPAIQWMRVAHTAMYATWMFLTLYCSMMLVVGIWLIRKFDRHGIPLSLSVPCVWVAFEYFRAHFPTGFPWLESTGILHRIGFGWYYLGYTQHDYLPLIQIADLVGVYGVSFLIALVNAVIYQWCVRCCSRCTVPIRPWVATAATAILLASTIAYGYSRLDHPPFAQGPRVAMLQSNLSQSVKMGQGDTVVRHMNELLGRAVFFPPGPPLPTRPDDEERRPRDPVPRRHKNYPDLVIWPETTCDADWYDVAPGVDPKKVPYAWRESMSHSEKLAQFMGRWHTNQLLGLNGMELDAAGNVWKYNSAKFINKGGKPGPRYDKMHLVPFGEYVPLRNTFPWMRHFTPYTHDYSCKPGEHWTRFPLKVRDKSYNFGCIICYEDTDPAIPRGYMLPSPEGPPVDFLVNISNDGWFNGTEEHEQHFAICRFRAIECRRSIVRAVNMGISGIIDPDGRVVLIPGSSWSDSKKIAVVVNGPVPIDYRESPYPHIGDLLPIACWITLIGGLVLCRIRRGVTA